VQRIIGIGSALVDVLSAVSEAFLASVPGEKGGMEHVDRQGMADMLARLPDGPSRVPGGSAANTVVGLSKLGLSTGLLSKIGSDEAGAFYRDSLGAAGVETRALKVDATEATGTCICLVTPDSERTMRTYLGASATLSAAEVTSADFRDCTHAHIEGYMLFNQKLMLHILETAKASGCTISLDLASMEVVRAARTILPAILREYADMVFANEDEAAAFAQTSDEREALRKLAAFCPLAAVKLGPRGSLVQRGGEFAAVEAQKASAVDTTGAGDLWASGFLYGLLTGGDLERAAAAGSLVGAAVVQEMGASIPEETWQRLRSDLGAE